MIPLPLLAAAALLIAALSAVGGWTARSVVADRDLAEMHVERAEAVAAAVEQARKTERTAAALLEQEVTNERTRATQAQARADALARSRAAAAADTDRLRDHIARLAAGAAAEHPAAAGGIEAVAGAGLVLADLYRSADDAATDLAPALDEARARGLSCERAYDAVRSTFMGTNLPRPAPIGD